MKEVFEKAEMSFVEFDNEDVISTSGCSGFVACTDETDEVVL